MVQATRLIKRIKKCHNNQTPSLYDHRNVIIDEHVKFARPQSLGVRVNVSLLQ